MKHGEMAPFEDLLERKRRVRKAAPAVRQETGFRQGALSAYDRAMNPGLTREQLAQAALQAARNRETEAEEKLEEYRRSPMRQQDWNEVMDDALRRINPGLGNLDLQIMDMQDTAVNQKEAALTAQAQYYKQQREAAEDADLMQKDMAQVSAMPPEDRQLLERYVAGRNEWLDHKAIADSTAAMLDLSKKYGLDRVKELAESYERSRNQRLSQSIAEDAWKSGDGVLSAVGQSAATVAANTIGSVASPLGYLQELFGRTGRYQTLDPHNIGTLPGQYAANVRQNVAGSIKGEGGLGRNLLALGYEGIMSAADTAARFYAAGRSGTGSLGLAAVGSFGSTVSEASAQGASPAQAVLLGTAKAGIEVLTEKLSLDELFRAGKDGAKGAGEIIRNVLRQGGIEATEEEISMLGGLAAEALILQEKSGHARKITDLVAGGMSYQEAKEQANRELWEEAVSTAARSFISGSAMEGGRAAGSYLLDRIGNGRPSTQPPAPDVPEAGPSDFREAEDELQAEEFGGGDFLIDDITPQEGPDEEFLRSADEFLDGRRDNDTDSFDVATTNAISNPVESYPPEKQKSIRSYLQAADENIRSFVQRVKSGDMTFRRQKISDVSQRAAGDIGKILGIDVSGYTHNINTNGVQHILKRHGERGKGDQSMRSDEDVARMGWVLENYDNVELLTEDGKQVYSEEFKDASGNYAPQIRFVKKIDGSYYVVEAACESKYKKLWVQSAYLQKNNGDVTEVPAVGNSTDREDYARSGLPSPSPDVMIPETGDDVNGRDEAFPEEGDAPGAPAEDGFGEPEDEPGRNPERNPGKSQRKKRPSAPEKWEGDGPVGSSQFRHETRRSKIYDNTYAHATNPDIRGVGRMAEQLDPGIAEYESISERESVANAELRTRNKRERNVEYNYLMKKQGWTGEDNDTAMQILKALRKEGNAEKFKALAKAQRERGTTAGQLAQSFAKYTKDPTKAAVDAVNNLDSMTRGDVDSRFWRRNQQGQQPPADDDQEANPADTPPQTPEPSGNTGPSGQQRKQTAFDGWKNEIVKSILEIGNEIENVEDGDVESMRDIVRQLANFRKTTAWWGMSSKLTKNAERILKKMDFDTAKEIACAQMGRIPEDFRKRRKGEIISSIRYNNMLSSLVSVTRNLAGNATTGLIDAMSDSTSGRFADMLMAHYTGKRTVGNDVRYAKEYLQAAIDAGDMAALVAELDIPAEHEGKYTGRTRTFSPQGGALSRFMSSYEKYMNYALQVTDEFFSGGTSGAVVKSLEALGQKSGLTDEEIAALGDRTGRRRTFKEGRKIARASAKVKEGLNIIGTGDFGLGDMTMPFAQTPAEMVQVAIDYSGSGILEGFVEMASIIKDAKNGDTIDVERQRKAVSDFGRGVSGVGLIATFAAMAAKGLIAVHDDPDKDKRGLEQSLGLSGAQFNLSGALRALQGGSTEWQEDDLTFSIDFLQPFNSQMYIGYLLSQEDDVMEMIKAYPGAAIQGIAQSMLDIPAMTTFSDLADLGMSFRDVSEGDFSAVTDAAGQLLGNQAGSFVPAWMRQTAQFIDPVYRDTSGDNTLDAAWNQVKSGLPFLSQTLPAKYDGLGNLQTRYDNPVLGFFNTFINPGALKRIGASEIADKLEALGDKSVYPEYLAPRSFKVDGETVMVSGKEMTETYQKTYGDNIAALYGGLMEMDDFAGLSQDQQITALKQAKSYAAQLAKAAVSDYDDIPEGSTEELTKGIIRDLTKEELSGAYNDLTKDWKENRKDDTEARENLEAAYETYSGLSGEAKKGVREQLGEKVLGYIEAREAGQSPDVLIPSMKITTQLGYSMDKLSEDLKNDGTGEEYLAALDGVYEAFKSLESGAQEKLLTDAEGREKYFLTAKNAGVETEAFAQLYGKYKAIDEAENTPNGTKAIEWAFVLHQAAEAGQITQAQAVTMQESMSYWNQIPAEPGKYMEAMDAGFTAEDARQIIDTIAQVTGTGSIDEETGKANVRPVDKYDAVAGMDFLDDAEMDIAMKMYMPDYDPDDENPDLTELRYEYSRRKIGLTAKEYAEAYRVITDGGKKDEMMAAWREMGFMTKQEAERFWRLHKGSGNQKIDVEAWWDKRPDELR